MSIFDASIFDTLVFDAEAAVLAIDTPDINIFGEYKQRQIGGLFGLASIMGGYNQMAFAGTWKEA